MNSVRAAKHGPAWEVNFISVWTINPQLHSFLDAKNFSELLHTVTGVLHQQDILSAISDFDTITWYH